MIINIFVLFFVIVQQVEQITCVIEIPNIPCPDVFEYIYDGKNWFAHITVPTPTEQKVVLSLNFSIQDINLSSYGKINLYDKDNVLSDIRNGNPIKYKVSLPKSRELPYVTEIRYNGEKLCSGPGVQPPSTRFWLSHTLNWYSSAMPINKFNSSFTLPGNKMPNRNFSPSFAATTTATTIPFSYYRNKYDNMLECGTIRKRRQLSNDNSVIPFIYNGTIIPRNSHPWLAALYDAEHGSLTFFCAGNLISRKHIVSAAHCTISKKNIEVKVGAHNTREAFEPGAVLSKAKLIINHPDYSSGSAHGDISIIVLANIVLYTDTIKPICLWNIEENFNFIIGTQGTIMGWGLTEDGSTSSTPLQTDVTINSIQSCEAESLLKKSISNMTICAGTRGAGPCLGDSGGGLYIKREGKWYLRGIISTSIADRKTRICDVHSNSVYADVAKYLDWIIDNMI